MFAMSLPGIHARGLDKLIEQLSTKKDYHSTVNVTVQQPMGDDVVYDVEVRSSAAVDRLSPCDYLIDWTLPAASGASSGFTSYSDGNMFRHVDNRLQEYNFGWDSIPFVINGGRSGVQRNAQFTNLLPQFIAEQLKEIATQPGWTYRFTPDTVSGGVESMVLTGRYTVNGFIGKNVLYVFDRETAMPRLVEFENNPTTLSEQVLVMKYDTAGDEPMVLLTEQALASRYPDVFDNYRESNFTIENMRGKYLPAFSVPTSTGQRYQRQKGDEFRCPTLIAVLDQAIATNPETVRAIRDGVAMLPGAADVIYAFVSSDVDAAENAVPDLQAGEHLLVSARGLARDCGVTSFPTLIFAGTDGKVKDVVIGFNKEMSTIVIEKIALAQ